MPNDDEYDEDEDDEDGDDEDVDDEGDEEEEVPKTVRESFFPNSTKSFQAKILALGISSDQGCGELFEELPAAPVPGTGVAPQQVLFEDSNDAEDLIKDHFDAVREEHTVRW